MRSYHILRRLLVATLLVAVVVFFAPSGALAHGGHSHLVPAANQITDAVATPRSVEALVVDSLSSAEALGFTIRIKSGISNFPASKPKSPQSCPGCCSYSSGTCSAAFLMEPIAIGVPESAHSRIERVIISGAGIKPDALHEPPKSLV